MVGAHEVVATVDPATGAVVETFDCMDDDAIDRALCAAVSAQSVWGRTDRARRAELLRSVATRLDLERENLARLAVAEMGKPVGEALAEIDKCVMVCRYYADTGESALADEVIDAGHMRSWTVYEPLGVLLAIMPWNYPYWQVWRFAAPALLAGNAILLKHSPNVTGCALAAERITRDAGVPEGVFQTLVVGADAVPDVVARLVADERIAAVSLTGSERAGAAVAEAAGRAVKKSVLELGGSDPFVVLADADLDVAVRAAVRSRFLNAGQSCLAAKRMLVHRARIAEFGQRLAAGVAGLVIGDPADRETQIGPLARDDLVSKLASQVDRSIDEGARCVIGGRRLEREGAWFQPTVLLDVKADMPVMAEETFGPVAVVTAFDDDDEAVRLANSTRYGLAASVWSTDVEHALSVGRRIRSGALFVNAVVASDPRLPFGGVKRSGYGRELGEAGAREFTNLRTVVIG